MLEDNLGWTFIPPKQALVARRTNSGSHAPAWEPIPGVSSSTLCIPTQERGNEGQQKVNCLKEEKKALMQQLLTGKRRVKIDEGSLPQKEVARA